MAAVSAIGNSLDFMERNVHMVGVSDRQRCGLGTAAASAIAAVSAVAAVTTFATIAAITAITGVAALAAGALSVGACVIRTSLCSNFQNTATAVTLSRRPCKLFFCHNFSYFMLRSASATFAASATGAAILAVATFAAFAAGATGATGPASAAITGRCSDSEAIPGDGQVISTGEGHACSSRIAAIAAVTRSATLAAFSALAAIATGAAITRIAASRTGAGFRSAGDVVPVLRQIINLKIIDSIREIAYCNLCSSSFCIFAGRIQFIAHRSRTRGTRVAVATFISIAAVAALAASATGATVTANATGAAFGFDGCLRAFTQVDGKAGIVFYVHVLNRCFAAIVSVSAVSTCATGAALAARATFTAIAACFAVGRPRDTGRAIAAFATGLTDATLAAIPANAAISAGDDEFIFSTRGMDRSDPISTAFAHEDAIALRIATGCALRASAAVTAIFSRCRAGFPISLIGRSRGLAICPGGNRGSICILALSAILGRSGRLFSRVCAILAAGDCGLFFLIANGDGGIAYALRGVQPPGIHAAGLGASLGVACRTPTLRISAGMTGDGHSADIERNLPFDVAILFAVFSNVNISGISLTGVGIIASGLLCRPIRFYVPHHAIGHPQESHGYSRYQLHTLLRVFMHNFSPLVKK